MRLARLWRAILEAVGGDESSSWRSYNRMMWRMKVKGNLLQLQCKSFSTLIVQVISPHMSSVPPLEQIMYYNIAPPRICSLGVWHHHISREERELISNVVPPWGTVWMSNHQCTNHHSPLTSPACTEHRANRQPTWSHNKISCFAIKMVSKHYHAHDDFHIKVCRYLA